jgi:hypothetical protein
MKHTMFVAAACLLFAACRKEDAPVTVITPVNHTVEFNLARTADYSAGYYDDVSAEIKCGITLVNHTTGLSTSVWDTTIQATNVRSLPDRANAIIFSKNVTNARPDNQSVHAWYNIRYFKAGTIQYQSAKNDPAAHWENLKRVSVNL